MSRFEVSDEMRQANEKIESPELSHGQASQSKKGEDFTFVKTECQRVLGDGVATYSVFGLFDGHNGSAAAIYSKENLLQNVLSAIPPDLSRDEWVAALPRALVAGFVKTDKDFQEKGMSSVSSLISGNKILQFGVYNESHSWPLAICFFPSGLVSNINISAKTSGTTVTFVIIEGWVVTVASVGDSRCILESAEGGIYYLSADHRLDCNEEERERITACGGEVGRLNAGGGTEIGPLRCWPGGLCLSRSIGDMDVGEYIVPVPYVKQVKLTPAGGRLVIASDGVWDALSAESAIECSRGMPADAAASQIVKDAVQPKGIRDDTTCIVVDIQLPEKSNPPPPPPPKRSGKGVFKSMFRKKTSESSSNIQKDFCEPDVVEELFEEGSASLSDRLDAKYPVCNMFKLFICAICQVEIKPGQGVSIHAGSSNTRSSRPWDGPFLCSSCQEKKEAMEGRRPFGGQLPHSL
ncbi:hypothetical protein H5410_024402 [Solanum commersonii]|uniref:PPM-type phosphatase domain-containing protein n=1 Tax=Solanum commersonii TaxID=4109 RepID=A0A9J5ZLU7_SOLCO|nr:hypothetical protein H5410_024402 [Solanum commersonii]